MQFHHLGFFGTQLLYKLQNAIFILGDDFNDEIVGPVAHMRIAYKIKRFSQCPE
jgi:hypothetical protein